MWARHNYWWCCSNNAKQDMTMIIGDNVMLIGCNDDNNKDKEWIEASMCPFPAQRKKKTGVLTKNRDITFPATYIKSFQKPWFVVCWCVTNANVMSFESAVTKTTWNVTKVTKNSKPKYPVNRYCNLANLFLLSHFYPPSLLLLPPSPHLLSISLSYTDLMPSKM